MLDKRNEYIGKRVRFYRTAKGISLEKLAAELPLRISSQQLAKYETGLSRWPVDLVSHIAAVLKEDILFLIDAEENGVAIGKGTPEWEAEKYKNRLLKLTPWLRGLCYKTIDRMAKNMEDGVYLTKEPGKSLGDHHA